MFPQFDTIPPAVVIPPEKMQSPFASSLDLSVHVEPENVPLLMVPADCIMVDT